MKPVLVSTLAALLVCATSLAGYHRFIVEPGQRIAVVDLDSVLSERQAALASNLVKADSDEQRAAVQRQAVEFAAAVQNAMGELAADCRCLVLERSVLVGPRPNMRDLTGELKRKVSP